MRRTRNVNGDGKAEIVVAKRGDNSVSILQGKSIPQPCLRIGVIGEICGSLSPAGKPAGDPV